MEYIDFMYMTFYTHDTERAALNTQQWPQDWKRSVFIPIPRKAMPKNAQTTTQLHSSHMLVK